MLKLFSTIILMVFALSACVTQPYNDSALASDLTKVNERIAGLENDLPEKLAQACAEITLDVNQQEQERWRAEEKKIVTKRRRAEEKRRAELACENRDKMQAKLPDGKLLLGAIETVKLLKEDLVFDARIDTGAVTSSIGVFNWRNFERDGKKWVKFSLTQDDDAIVYEYPVHGKVSIKQTGTLIEERLEIKVDIEIGGIEYKNQIFNMTDRSHLNYQLLIGRSFLRDIAVVDVASKKLLSGS